MVSLSRARPFGQVNRLLVGGHDGIFNLLGISLEDLSGRVGGVICHGQVDARWVSHMARGAGSGVDGHFYKRSVSVMTIPWCSEVLMRGDGTTCGGG